MYAWTEVDLGGDWTDGMWQAWGLLSLEDMWLKLGTRFWGSPLSLAGVRSVLILGRQCASH